MKYLLTLFFLIGSLNIYSNPLLPHNISNKSGQAIKASELSDNFNALKPKISYLQERYADDVGVSGTTTNSNTYIHPLNVIQGNTSFISLNTSNGQFTLQEGTYDITGYCMIYVDGNGSCLIREVGGSVVIPGGPVYNGTLDQRASPVLGLITVSGGSKTYELVQFIQDGKNVAFDGNQYAVGVDEIYANLRVQKID